VSWVPQPAPLPAGLRLPVLSKPVGSVFIIKPVTLGVPHGFRRAYASRFLPISITGPWTSLRLHFAPAVRVTA